MHRFYTPEIDEHSDEYLLSPEESKHACRVLRLKQGDQVSLVDGRGNLYSAAIKKADAKKTVLEIISVIEDCHTPTYHLHMAVAPTKNMDRLEWFIEKATEIGLQEFTPIICHNSERKLIKIERLERVAVAAMKQSLKSYMPRINPPIDLSVFLAQHSDGEEQKYVAHCLDDDNKTYLDQNIKKGERYIVLIGPEGDFSDKEIRLSIDRYGFTPISLGEARLRTETAALASCVEISIKNRH